jgi:hypothetical protein
MHCAINEKIEATQLLDDQLFLFYSEKSLKKTRKLKTVKILRFHIFGGRF